MVPLCRHSVTNRLNTPVILSIVVGFVYQSCGRAAYVPRYRDKHSVSTVVIAINLSVSFHVNNNMELIALMSSSTNLELMR